MELPSTSANPHTTPADIEQGRKLYGGRCAGCHGPTGDGGKGANLAQPQLPRAMDDLSLYRVVRYGIPDTEMPATLLAPREVWQICAFVRSLGRLASSGPTGDARNGESIVRGKGGCLACHSIGTEGGRSGPSLLTVGSRRSPGHLRAKLTDPGADVPENYRWVELTAKDGKKAVGPRLNEDTWSIQLLDGSGRLLSYWKKDLASLKSERKTPMPSYQGKLTTSEINDAVTYLSTLRGIQ
ncbi:MAG: c-type cytochrome [Acidobacteria bacterium]|nr:c-type cytochrome [Acidobacteriota bacterium]